MSEDCTRCGSELEWLLEHGCPVPGTRWCLLWPQPPGRPESPAEGGGRPQTP